MRILYILGIRIFSLFISIAAFFNEKARLLKNGRKNLWKQIKEIGHQSPVVWVHCASLGEFEQGRPIIEAIRSNHPEFKILLTFFSPSGYEVRKNYNMAHWVTYLPADTPQNAKKFIETVKPTLALFVKYEFWPCFFETLHKKNIPIISVSSIFRENQIFFRWYGTWFRKTLKKVQKFYVQDKTSAQLLKKAGILNCDVVGDTRFDRVTDIVKNARQVPIAESFAKDASLVVVAGSTWPPDEDLLINYINNTPDDVKIIIAPHEVHESHISQIEQKLKVPYLKFSKINSSLQLEFAKVKVLIVDTIGLLSAIYRYGNVAYIGGGFGKGIHNTLEAATYGIPVIFGPKYQKFKEARDLIKCEGGFSINNYSELFSLIEGFRNKPTRLKASGQSAASYVSSMCGATDIIMKELFPIST